MKQWRLHFPVIIMSRVLRVSRSGFYTWLKRKPSRRTQEDARLKVAIKAAHKRTREVYGARRLQPELAADGFVAGRDRIARLRREMGIRCRQKRKFKATTNSNHNLPVAEMVRWKILPIADFVPCVASNNHHAPVHDSTALIARNPAPMRLSR